MGRAPTFPGLLYGAADDPARIRFVGGSTAGVYPATAP